MNRGPAPRLTIGLPTYNGEEYLASALDSLLAQTFGDFELIISDNASTDSTQEIAERYAAADPRIRYVRHEQNQGSAFNHTFVIREAQGEYFKWASDDDLYEPELLERCVAVLDARPEVAIAHSGTTRIDQNGDVIDLPGYTMRTDSPDPAVRLRDLLRTDGGDDIYGVMRSTTLERMPDYGSFLHSDRTFVAQMALSGSFEQVGGNLYLRREHTGRGGQASNDVRRLCSILDPKRANRFKHPVVRLVGEYLWAYVSAIVSAPIRRRDQARCLLELTTWFLGHTPRPRRHRPPMERVAFYGFLGSGNLGNDASLESALHWFRTHRPDTELSCITLAPEVTRERYGLPSTSLRVQTERRLPLHLERLTSRVSDLRRTFSIVSAADTVVVPGMGVLEENIGVRYWGLPLWMFMVALGCRALGRKFVLLDVGAEPIEHPVTRWLFHRTVQLSTDVSYRDTYSVEAMSGSGRAPDAIAPDIAFAHPDDTVPEPVPGRVVVGVLTWYGKLDDPAEGQHRRDGYVRSMTGVLVALLDQGDTVVLVGGDRADREVAEELLEAVRRLRTDLPADQLTIRMTDTFAGLAAEMARAEVTVASRFHNLICSLRLGIPAVSVGYAVKSDRLMEAFGLGEYVQDIADLDADRLLAQLKSARSDRVALSASIRERSDTYRNEVLGLLDATSSRLFGPAPKTAENGRTRADARRH